MTMTSKSQQLTDQRAAALARLDQVRAERLDLTRTVTSREKAELLGEAKYPAKDRATDQAALDALTREEATLSNTLPALEAAIREALEKETGTTAAELLDRMNQLSAQAREKYAAHDAIFRGLLESSQELREIEKEYRRAASDHRALLGIEGLDSAPFPVRRAMYDLKLKYYNAAVPIPARVSTQTPIFWIASDESKDPTHPANIKRQREWSQV